jgi:hypothetical protein
MALLFVLSPAALFLSACGDGSEEGGQPDCLDAPASPQCSPLFPAPDFSRIYSEILATKCASGGGACHGPQSAGRNGGLVFDGADASREMLLRPSSSGRPRVTPGDLRCGELIVRLETPGEPWSMPRGGHLEQTELCTIRQWIANGAAP